VQEIEPPELVPVEKPEVETVLVTEAGDVHDPSPRKTLVDATVPDFIDRDITFRADERPQVP